MLSDIEKLMAQLDRDEPNWWRHWASQQTLVDCVGLSEEEAKRKCCYDIQWRLARVVHAALSCKIVRMPDGV